MKTPATTSLLAAIMIGNVAMAQIRNLGPAPTYDKPHYGTRGYSRTTYKPRHARQYTPAYKRQTCSPDTEVWSPFGGTPAGDNPSSPTGVPLELHGNWFE